MSLVQIQAMACEKCFKLIINFVHLSHFVIARKYTFYNPNNTQTSIMLFSEIKGKCFCK